MELYSVPSWGAGAFSINAKGHVEVQPTPGGPGIDLLDLLKEGIVRPARVINLRTITGLDGIRVGPSGDVRLGALVTLARIAESTEVLAHCPALAEAARQFVGILAAHPAPRAA